MQKLNVFFLFPLNCREISSVQSMIQRNANILRPWFD